MKNSLATIHELRIESNWRIDNGKDSFVVPFPSTYPFTLVFHGQSKFEYGHYGIHLGQEDRLTFLGDPNQEIKAYFIDCRKDSPTKGKRLIYILNPSSEYCLCIPPGVAHAFDGLENIYTLNTYKLYLPSPDKWLNGETNWNIENDVINLPMDVSDDQLNFFEPNNCEASEVFYELIRAHQKENLPKIDSEYPFTEDLEFNDGSSARLMFRKTELKKNHFPDWEPIEGIQGLGWEKHLIYWSGDESGFIPFLDSSTFYVVDHGVESYTHDAFGIHLSQQDRLTFVGDPDQTVTLHLVDCRQDSPTKHQEIKIEFKPSPLRFLVIPTGVAHRFENLHKVFTINRPFIYSDDIEEYEPGNDVIDWDIANKSYPSYQVSSQPATEAFYKLQARSQQSLMSQPATHSTPIVIATVDNEGNDIKVAIRKNE
ncbi:dTDP-4-dehydrorhamnose 3,5-epimerase [Pedobacter steynii]|uniref:dTDP-4-dehydrorhamnose 3,5-epimerase n=1 Tax=Pedobacter steynii TaxID=430522 RepID=A0A1H0GKY7_9SPHI|nr:dTDP-4-dehydrorhamnose 3,5-epimerase family protein [Pedobacter steynii]NQX42449.1 dTDP-4-dehydrorhamnose 3,5-epimerase family protein [Pedobacter steynii]SDO07419.1 dTDP-4-dehydrorhamnose 3,5-epimerase [Pedobacter steynii]